MMVKNLLFDLGGVIMNIRRQNAVDALIKIGMADADSFLGDYAQQGPFLKLEEGAISESEFRNEIRVLIPVDVTDEQIDDAFCHFLLGIPKYRLDALENLHKSYKIYMLSNTNSIMWNSVISDEFKKAGHDINYYFDGLVTSFEAKCVKPDAKIFNSVVENFNIKPEETIFFDDSQANIDAAAALGFKTAYVMPGTEFMDLIK